MTRSKSAGKDLDKMRRQLAELDAEVAEIESKLTALADRREAIESQLSGLDAQDLATRWELEEALGETETEVEQLVKAKVRPSVRAGQLRAVLSPVIERERETEIRVVRIAQMEKLLEVAALMHRIGDIAAEARNIEREHGKTLYTFPTTIKDLAAQASKWETTIAPQIRQQLASDRLFVGSIEDQR